MPQIPGMYGLMVACSLSIRTSVDPLNMQTHSRRRRSMSEEQIFVEVRIPHLTISEHCHLAMARSFERFYHLRLCNGGQQGSEAYVINESWCRLIRKGEKAQIAHNTLHSCVQDVKPNVSSFKRNTLCDPVDLNAFRYRANIELAGLIE